jgi:hypothetical protein
LKLLFATYLEHAFQLASKIKAKLPKTNNVCQKKSVSSSQPPTTSKAQPNINEHYLGSPNTTLAIAMQKKRNGCSYQKKNEHFDD